MCVCVPRETIKRRPVAGTKHTRICFKFNRIFDGRRQVPYLEHFGRVSSDTSISFDQRDADFNFSRWYYLTIKPLRILLSVDVPTVFLDVRTFTHFAKSLSSTILLLPTSWLMKFRSVAQSNFLLDRFRVKPSTTSDGASPAILLRA